jgi:adenine C2-methylase RlmN of 23S rRNA A2503 and tRNA A37
MLLRDKVEDHETDLEMAFDLIANLEANEGCDCECKFQKTIKHLVKRVVEMEEILNAMDRDRRFERNPFSYEFDEVSGNCNCR